MSELRDSNDDELRMVEGGILFCLCGADLFNGPLEWIDWLMSAICLDFVFHPPGGRPEE